MTKLEAIALAALFFTMIVAGGIICLGWIESWQRRRDRRYAEEVLQRSRLAHWDEEETEDGGTRRRGELSH